MNDKQMRENIKITAEEARWMLADGITVTQHAQEVLWAEERIDDLEDELAALRRTVANMEYERNNQLPNYGIYAAGSFIKLLRKKLDEDRLCYHDAIDYCIQNELEWAVPRKEESNGE